MEVEVEFGVLIYEEIRKSENTRKNHRRKNENQQQTEPTYDAGPGDRIRAKLVGQASAVSLCSPPLILLNLPHWKKSLFLFSLLLHLLCFSILVNYYFKLSFDLKAITKDDLIYGD